MLVNGNTAYGSVGGFEANLNIALLDNISPVKLHISFYGTDEQKRAIDAALRNERIKYFRHQFTPYGILIGLNDFTVKRLAARLDKLLERICGILSENGAVGEGRCPVCGNELTDATKCKPGWFEVMIDNACKDNINAVIDEENKDFKNAPNNYLRGFAGAAIGAAVGAAITVIFYLIGYVTAISAIVSVILGTFLYEKFHGKPNKMMLVIVSVTTLAFMVASIFGVYIGLAGYVAAKEGIDLSAFEAFGLLLEDADFATGFYLDLGLVVLFTALGMGVQIAYIVRKIRRQQNIG